MHARDIAIACEDIEPLLAAAALSEHDDDATRATIGAHLATCAHCQQTLAAYHSLARLLPMSAPEGMPAPDLRERVLDAVEAAAQGKPLPNKRTRARRFFPPWLSFAHMGQAIGAVLLVTLLVWNITLQQRLTAQQAAQQQQAAALAALLQDPQLERRSLTGDAPAPTSHGTLFIARNRQIAALTVEGLPTLPMNKVYQLWLVKQKQRTNGGTFTVDATGHGTLLVQAPQPLDTYDAVGVTMEPRGGSIGPTTPRVIGGRLD